MSWRVVHVHYGEQMKLKLDNLLVLKQGKSITIPLSDISMIVAEGGDTIVTLRLLSALSQYNIILIVCDGNHLPTGMYLSQHAHFRAHKVFHKQIQWSEEQKEWAWALIVYFKLANQMDHLILLDKEELAISQIAQYMEQMESGDKTNREGHAAKVYFNALFGKKFNRKSGEACDILNAGLNYGYTILRAQMARTLCGSGLNPLLGVFHKNEYNAFPLADDLMEPFRPFVDYWVYLNLKEKEYLTYESRLGLINIVNAEVSYNHEKCTITAAMEKYVRDFIKVMEDGELSRLNYPILSSVKWSE